MEHHYDVVRGYGLPDAMPDGIDHEELIVLMGRDKKRSSEAMTFVLDGPRGVELVEGVPPSDVEAALREVGQ
jgi:5-deoxy-5-amino-3-dehydroquinate synthase